MSGCGLGILMESSWPIAGGFWTVWTVDRRLLMHQWCPTAIEIGQFWILQALGLQTILVETFQHLGVAAAFTAVHLLFIFIQCYMHHCLVFLVSFSLCFIIYSMPVTSPLPSQKVACKAPKARSGWSRDSFFIRRFHFGLASRLPEGLVLPLCCRI